MTQCQNHPGRLAIWPVSEPHICALCALSMDERRIAIEKNNYRAALARLEETRRKKQGIDGELFTEVK